LAGEGLASRPLVDAAPQTFSYRLFMTEREDGGDLHLATVVINVQDMGRAVSFWSAALGYRPRETTIDTDFMMLVDRSGTGLPVSLKKADSPPKEPVRLHLDLYTDEQERHVFSPRRSGCDESRRLAVPE